MSATTELAAKLKAAIRGEGEPGHPGEMISVVEAEYLIDEVFAEPEAAPSDTDLRDLHARYHSQPGNMLGPNECEWERCEFWDVAQFALSAALGGGE